MLRVPHNPGALMDALDIFRANKINLTWIESFPMRSDTGKAEFMFFVDFEGHVDDAKSKRALLALEKQCEQLVILGSFPVAVIS